VLVDVLIDAHKVIIADDGIGMNLNAPSTHPKGHGIGLQLVTRLCDRLGWRVELYDRQQFFLSSTDMQSNTSTTGLVVVIYLS
jgi:two-component sensor histidine kinase